MANCRSSLHSQDPLPVGFRFSPTDEELLNHYLKNKVFGNESLVTCIPQIDVYEYEPWDLPGLLSDHTGVEKLFFFSALDFKNSNGKRTSRVTKSGFWKSTGYDREIRARGTNKLIGTKKSLVYHGGRARNGNRTNWVIHQYRLHTDTPFQNLRSFVVCRLKKKSDVKVAQFDRPNDHAIFENAIIVNGIQESSPLLHCTGQPALPDSQIINASDCGVNWQSIQPEATESYFDPNEFLNLFDSPGQPALPDFQSHSGHSHHKASNAYFEDGTSQVCWFPFYSESKPASMYFQPANGNDGEVNNQLLQPGASESQINLTEYMNSFPESENNNDVTSRIFIDSYDREEPSNWFLEFQNDEFSRGTDNVADFGWLVKDISDYLSVADFGWQSNDIPPSRSYRRVGSATKTKCFQSREEKEIYSHEAMQGSSSRSISSPLSHCTGQPAFPDSQSINASDYGVNRQSRQPESNGIPPSRSYRCVGSATKTVSVFSREREKRSTFMKRCKGVPLDLL